MKKILLLAAFLLSLAPAFSETQVLDKNNVATEYSKKVVDENNCEWTYITNAAEFMKLVSDCQFPFDEAKFIKLACDIEYPGSLDYVNNPEYFIKYFYGKFDGMGCTIKNFNIKTKSTDEVDIGFIQVLGANSEVYNLRFDDCYLDSRHSGTVALVVNQLPGDQASIHDIYIKRGRIYVDNSQTVVGCLVCEINSNTAINHCAIDSLEIGIVGHNEGNLAGFFGTRMKDDADVTSCSINNCYLVSTPLYSSIHAKFSCITQYTAKELDKKEYRHENCFWDKNSHILFPKSIYIDFDVTVPGYKVDVLGQIGIEQLKNGSTLNDPDGWMCQTDSMPKPAGLFYWSPKKDNSIKVGTYGTSQDLMGTATSIDYCRYIESAQLKLTSITPQGETDYVIDDSYTNEIGVINSFKTIKENVFSSIPMTTLKLPGLVTEVEGDVFRHRVSDGFVSNGNWRYAGNCLYLNTDEISRLITTVGDNEELTIDGLYCTEILDEAFLSQENLTHLYINTWFPTTATSYPPITLLGNKVFTEECYNTKLEVYVKDGTLEQLIIGEDIEHGYKYFDGSWKMFYSENQDRPNRLFQYFPVTRNPAGLSTLVLGYPVKLPSDCRAWIATGIDGDKLVLKRIKGNIVPAQLPVLLSYENKEGIMHLTPYEGTDAPVSTQYDTENLLFKGSIDPAGQSAAPSEMQANALTLQLHPSYPSSWDKVGFYRFTGDVLPSYVAWIPISEVPSNAHLAMVFDGDYEFTNPTGIIDVADQVANPSAAVYNLSGQRVGSSYRGMVIKNGRKYIAK